MARDAITTMVDPASNKVVIDGLDGFRVMAGRRIGTSEPVKVTQSKIKEFCRAVDNTEWIHRDVERCRKSPFGTTIAPAMFTQAYFSRLWSDMADIRHIKSMLFLGSDRVRLITPLKCGTEFTMTVFVDHVEEKEKGIAVHLDVTWNVLGEEKPVAAARNIIRYAD